VGGLFRVPKTNYTGFALVLETWKVLEFCCGIFQGWKVLEKGFWSWKVLEICLTEVKNMKFMADRKEN